MFLTRRGAPSVLRHLDRPYRHLSTGKRGPPFEQGSAEQASGKGSEGSEKRDKMNPEVLEFSRAEEGSPEAIRALLQTVKKEMKETMSADGKPSKEYMDLFTQLAAGLKKTDVTAKQQQLNNPKAQDFRAFVAKRKNNTNQGLRYTNDEMKILFKQMQEGQFPDVETEKLKRILKKYELISIIDEQ